MKPTSINILNEQQIQDVQNRIEKYVELGSSYVPIDSTEKFALSCLFSELSYLEEIAVIAATRGDSIEGQLEDEFVHRETFKRLAQFYGGVQSPSPGTVVLLEYLSKQEGELSLALLNVVAESWLETVFDNLSSWGYADELLAQFEQDEERHVHDALKMAKPPSEECEPHLRKLEQMLSDIMTSFQFTLPMMHLGGLKKAATIGLDICKAHKKACQHLNVKPDVVEIEKSCRAQIQQFYNDPTPLEMNDWEKSRCNIWETPAPMCGYFECPLPSSSPGKNIALLIKCINKLLILEPSFNKVVRNDQLWSLQNSIVGLRTKMKDERLVTLYVTKTEKSQLQAVLRKLNKAKRRAHKEKFPLVPKLNEYKQLLPPARCAVVLNYNGHFGHNVTGPLNDIEGVPIQVMVGELYQRADRWYASVSVMVDHRVHDGHDVSKFGKLLFDLMTKYT